MKRIEPKPGQESVWDYPRPPRLEPSTKHLRIEFGEETIASTNRAFRVLETSHPPVYYFPPEDVRLDLLTVVSDATSFCEWKGSARYYDLFVKDRKVSNAAWFYPNPSKAFLAIANYVAFYPSKMDACFVGDERVTSQPGDFYGGWITSDIVGPFKGGEGTWGW
ncbi:MAG TPA: DUF427 domain-containing protein [Pyrinomonadaceae bacterium]|nr:DUF427 domain-containing protein [Acidobacteriota bacterium]HQZ95420.1 DUF427 domain-containing protein [Pyrinomonadaceae bacterium]